MKKFLYFLAICSISVNAVAQQWLDGTSSTDTIYRTGKTMVIPSTIGQPFGEWDSSSFKISKKYGEQYHWEFTEISYDGITLGRNVPAPSSTAFIGRGNFYFNNFNTTKSMYLKYYSNGLLETNGKILCEDSVVAKNVRATNSINAFIGNFSSSVTAPNGTFSTKVQTPTLAVNNSSVPTNLNWLLRANRIFLIL